MCSRALCAIGEISVLTEPEHVLTLFSLKFWLALAFASTLGFCISLVVVSLIDLTSPLSYTMVGVFKNSLQTVLAVYIWQNPITARGMLGVALVLVGSFLYAKVKGEEAEAAKKSTVLPIVNEDESSSP